MSERLNTVAGMPVLVCAKARQQDAVVQSIYHALKEKGALNPTGRNHTDLVHMSLHSEDEQPDRFASLLSWSKAMFTAAGYRDQFEGLVLLNISGIRDAPRLRALAEGIERWCKRCYVVLYGPEPDNEEYVVCLANTLDLYGKLRICVMEGPEKQAPDALAEIDRRGYNISLTARRRLAGMIDSVAEKPGFSLGKYFNALDALRPAYGALTEEILDRIEADPFSYHNRLHRQAASKPVRRRIGFAAGDDARAGASPVRGDNRA